MHEVVVMAVKKAVSAATTTFTAISMNRFFITFYLFTFLPFAYPCDAVCSVIQSSRGVTFLMYCFLVGSCSSGVRSTFSSTP